MPRILLAVIVLLLTACAGHDPAVAESTAQASDHKPPAAAGYRARGNEPFWSITVERVLCRDSMSGMPFPDTVTLHLDGRDHPGCGGEALDLLSGKEWTITRILGHEVVEPAPTLAFLGDARAAGSTSCNRWNAPFLLSGEGLGFGLAASTMMACAEATMMQERAFLDALARITRHDFDAQGALLLKAGDETLVVATPSPAPEPDA